MILVFKIWFLLIGLCFILVKISVLYITINLSKVEENGSRFMQFIEASFMAGNCYCKSYFWAYYGKFFTIFMEIWFLGNCFFSLLTIGFLYSGKTVWQKVYTNTSDQKSTIALSSWQVMKNHSYFWQSSFYHHNRTEFYNMASNIF